MPIDPDDPAYVTIGEGELAITAGIYKDGYNFGIDENGRGHIAMTYQIEAVNGFAWCNALRGIGPYAVNNFPKPHRHPTTPDLICMSAQGRWVGNPIPHKQGMTSEWAHIDAVYSTPELNPFGDSDTSAFEGALDDGPIPWSDFRIRGGTEMVSIPAKDLVAGDGAVTLDQKLPWPVPTCDYEFIRGKMPDMPGMEQLLNGLSGKLNATPFFGKERGTLYLDNWDAEPDNDGIGQRLLRYTMVFRWRKYDHNMEPKPGALGDDAWVIVKDSSDRTRFAYADFRPLLRYGVL